MLFDNTASTEPVTPASRFVTPDMSMARVGAQLGAAWKLAKRTPFIASASKLGVGISLPNDPISV